MEELRAVKEPAELAAIERAAAIADEALARLLARLRAPGAAAVTERQAAWQLERTMRDLGAEGVAFDVDVASGPNSASARTTRPATACWARASPSGWTWARGWTATAAT